MNRIRTSIANPHILIRYLRDRLVDVYSHTQREVLGNTGIAVMEADWDNLLILDGCRYDLFKEVNTIEGDLRPVISKGSSTPEFLDENFEDDTFLDTVYIAAIPMVEEQGIGNQFHDIIRVWKTDWDSDLQTIPPEPMAERVLETAKKYPNKRLIAHFLQPHYPFIGPTGKTIPHPTVEGPGLPERPDDEPDYVWGQLKSGRIDRETVWRAYKENLELALPSVSRLTTELTGKSIVTSDHGNAFGEWGVYGHPTYRQLYLKALVKVPWLECNWTERKSITRGEQSMADGESDETLQDKLQALGYV